VAFGFAPPDIPSRGCLRGFLTPRRVVTTSQRPRFHWIRVSIRPSLRLWLRWLINKYSFTMIVFDSLLAQACMPSATNEGVAGMVEQEAFPGSGRPERVWAGTRVGADGGCCAQQWLAGTTGGWRNNGGRAAPRWLGTTVAGGTTWPVARRWPAAPRWPAAHGVLAPDGGPWYTVRRAPPWSVARRLAGGSELEPGSGVTVRGGRNGGLRS